MPTNRFGDATRPSPRAAAIHPADARLIHQLAERRQVAHEIRAYQDDLYAAARSAELIGQDADYRDLRRLLSRMDKELAPVEREIAERLAAPH